MHPNPLNVDTVRFSTVVIWLHTSAVVTNLAGARYRRKFFSFTLTMHWAVRNNLFLFLNASSWLPYSTVRWLVFNVNKLHFLQSVSLEQYSIFARKIIKKLSNSAPFISIFIIIYTFIRKSKHAQPASFRP